MRTAQGFPEDRVPGTAASSLGPDTPHKADCGAGLGARGGGGGSRKCETGSYLLGAPSPQRDRFRAASGTHAPFVRERHSPACAGLTPGDRADPRRSRGEAAAAGCSPQWRGAWAGPRWMDRFGRGEGTAEAGASGPCCSPAGTWGTVGPTASALPASPPEMWIQ